MATPGDGEGPRDPGAPRSPRADAMRNRARLLEAAEAVFAAEGIDAPVDDIAEKAGVGVGTLYRHFPTKEKLLVAILVERVGEISTSAKDRLAGTEDPGAAFFGFFDYLVGQALVKRDLINALSAAGVDTDPDAIDAKHDLADAIGELLRAAQAAGAVRRDVTAPVILSLMGATCVAADHQDADVSSEMLAIVRDGLRAAGAGR